MFHSEWFDRAAMQATQVSEQTGLGTGDQGCHAVLEGGGQTPSLPFQPS